MLIKVDNLVKGFSEPVACKGSVTLPDNFSADNKVADVEVNGSITNSNGKYVFEGNVNAVLTLNCDSCLKPFTYKLDFVMNEVYTKSDNPEEEELHFTDKTIDLKPAIIADILLNLPMKAMCSENCKGLCRICGHDLNEGDCGCDRTYIDPRFEMLRSLFDDKEV